MQITLPLPCPECSGPVVYSGRGRRPELCSDACRRSLRAADERERRARVRSRRDDPDAPLMHALAEIIKQAEAARRYVEVRRANDEHLMSLADLRAEVAGDGDVRTLADHGYVPDRWAERKARPRRSDPAAQWLAEHHPRELADFPPAV